MNILKVIWDGHDFLEEGKSFYSGAKILNHLKYEYLKHREAVKLLQRARNCSRQLSGNLKKDIDAFLEKERL